MLFKASALLAAVNCVTLSPFASAQSIVDIAVSDGRFNTLVAAVTKVGLVSTLSGDGSFTVFAPTDEAFTNVNVTVLLEDQWRAHLQATLLYHVLGSEIFSTDLEVGMMAETLEGSSLTVTSLDPPQVDFAEIVTADIDASNGVIHVIDDVLLPPSMTNSIVDIAVATPTLSTLVNLVVEAGLEETLSGGGPYTVFAPTDEAFGMVDQATLDTLLGDPTGLLTQVLTYHVVPGIILAEDLTDASAPITVQGAPLSVSVGPSSVKINNANVVLSDVLASNGVVHVIDSVLLPPSNPIEPVPENPIEPEPEPENPIEPVPENPIEPVPENPIEPDPKPDNAPAGTIVDIAGSNPDFTTLVAALGVADLVGALQGDGPFTVFAPVNSAFDLLDVEKLLEDQWRAHLTGILLYHAVSGLIMSSDLSLDASAVTLEGSDVTVTSLDPVMINDATVISADVQASNGVIHVVDKVLLPPFAVNNIVEIAVSDPSAFSTLVDLLLLTNLDDELSGDGPFTVFAPTNAAFSKLPQETVDALIADPAGALTDILLYHVVPGIVLSSDLSEGSSPATLQGATLDVSLNPVMINNANVVTADVLASNGVIHIVDTVLLPPANLPADGYQQLMSVSYAGQGDACMEVKDKVTTNGQRVILGDCTAAGSGWRVDDNHMIHSELNDDFCLQAGYGGRHGMVGRVIRIQRCDDHNHLQRWEFTNGQELKPQLNDNLCAVWRGVTANVGSDPMIMLQCSEVGNMNKWILA